MNEQIENESLPVGTDIIDATQNAVIEAVTNVSELIEKSTTESTISSHQTDEIFYRSVEFWVGMAFVLVVFFVSKPLFTALKKGLIKRQEKIASEIQDAQSLQDEAQTLLAKYERQALNAKSEAEDLLKTTYNNIELQKHARLASLEQETQKRKTETKKIIEASVLKAQKELNLLVGDKTTTIVKTYLKQTLNAKKRSKLIDASISNILKKLP